MKIKKAFIFYKKIIKESQLKKYFLFSTILFLLFFVSGYLLAEKNTSFAEAFFGALSEKYAFASNFNYLQTFYFIFLNNITIALVAYLSGVIFGLPSFFILLANSFVIGVVVRVAVLKTNIAFVLFSLIPHGIFEIPAILIALSIGFLLGTSIFNFLFRKISPKKEIILSLKIFFSIVLPLFFFAAVIESILVVFFK